MCLMSMYMAQPEDGEKGTNNNAAEEPTAPPDDIGDQEEPRVNGYCDSFSDVSAGELDTPVTDGVAAAGETQEGETSQDGGGKSAQTDTVLDMLSSQDSTSSR